MNTFTIDSAWFFYSVGDLLRQFVDRVKLFLALYVFLGILRLHDAVLTQRAISASPNNCCVHLLSNLSSFFSLWLKSLLMAGVSKLGLVSRAHIWRAFVLHHIWGIFIRLKFVWKFCSRTLATERIHWRWGCVCRLDMLSSAYLLLCTMMTVEFSYRVVYMQVDYRLLVLHLDRRNSQLITRLCHLKHYFSNLIFRLKAMLWLTSFVPVWTTLNWLLTRQLFLRHISIVRVLAGKSNILVEQVYLHL